MVVSEDISLVKVSNYAGKILVSHFNGKFAGEMAVHKWIEQHWKPLLGYVP